MISLTDIANIEWANDKKCFFIPKSNDYTLLAEFLSNHTFNSINEDIKNICNFKAILDKGDKERINEFLMRERMGYELYKGVFIGYIAGAMDFSVGLYYSEQEGYVFLKHIVIDEFPIEKISIDNLLQLLYKVREKIIPSISE